jgi:hypothetical protein
VRAFVRARVCVCLRAFSVSCAAVMCEGVFKFRYSSYVECYNGPTTRRAATWRPRSRQRGCSLQPSCRGLLTHSQSHGTTATFTQDLAAAAQKETPGKMRTWTCRSGSSPRPRSAVSPRCSRRSPASAGRLPITGGSGEQPHDRAVGTLRAPNISRLGLRRLA